MAFYHIQISVSAAGRDHSSRSKHVPVSSPQHPSLRPSPFRSMEALTFPSFFCDSDVSSTACYPSSPPSLPILPPEEEPVSAFDPSAAAYAADVVPLRRLSQQFLSLLDSSPELAFCSDGRIVVGSGESTREVSVHRCVLSARSPFFRERFSAGEEGDKLDLKKLLPGFDVEYEALAAVLKYIYGGRVEELPRGVAECADEECGGHEACWPAVHFMIQVLYAAATFKIQEVVSLFQRHLLDILQKIVVDDVLQVLFVAYLCESSCLKLFTKCCDIIVKSDIDYMTLGKRLPTELVEKIMESRSNLGLDEEQLLRITDKNMKIYGALDNDDIQLVQLFLEEGRTTLDDAFALHYAVAHCDPKSTKELLDLEIADVNLRNQRGYTVLHIAAMRQDPDIIMSLLTKGAQTSDLTPDNRKALQISKRLTKSIDYHSQVEQGKDSPRGRACIEMLENAEVEDSFAKVNCLPFAMENYDLPRKLLYLETRVWLANVLFPMEAKVAMKTARVDGTLKFKPKNVLFTLNLGPTEDETAMPSDMTEEHLLRMEALNKTVKLGMRYFPRCSTVINKFLGDDLSEFNISTDITTEYCRKRYKELHDDIMDAFTQDKEELNRSASKSSRNFPNKRAKRR